MYANTGIQNVYNMYVSTSSDRLCRGGGFRSVEWHEMTIRSIRKPWTIGMSVRCRSNEKLRLWGASTNDHMVVEMDGTWLSGSSSSWVNQWTNEWMNECINEWVNHCMNQPMSESLKEWMSEWFNQWLNGRVNQWVPERSMNESLNEGTNEWVNQWRNDWMNQPLNQRMREPMNEWFVESMTN